MTRPAERSYLTISLDKILDEPIESMDTCWDELAEDLAELLKSVPALADTDCDKLATTLDLHKRGRTAVVVVGDDYTVTLEDNR